MPRKSSEQIWLALLLIGALLVRVGWVLHITDDESALRLLPDQVEYLEIAKNLLHGHDVSFVDHRFGQRVEAYRTPGYPAFIALCRAKLSVIRLAQAAIDTSTVLAAYLLARRWLSPRAARFAALLVAINPFMIYFCGLILSETLFIALLAWGMTLVVRERRQAWLAGAALLAASVIVRPSAILLPALLTLRNPARCLIACGLTVLILFPWALRNHQTLSEWIWTTTNAGITEYDGFNPDADGSSNQSFVDRMPELAEMGEIDRDRYLSDKAAEYRRAHPLNVLRLTVIKIARTWSPIPLSNEYRSRRMYVLLAAFYSVPFDLLVILGLWRGNLPARAKVFLMVPAIYLTVVHACSVGSLRYRIPAEAPMAVVAAGLIGQRSVAREKLPGR